VTSALTKHDHDTLGSISNDWGLFGNDGRRTMASITCVTVDTKVSEIRSLGLASRERSGEGDEMYCRRVDCNLLVLGSLACCQIVQHHHLVCIIVLYASPDEPVARPSSSFRICAGSLAPFRKLSIPNPKSLFRRPLDRRLTVVG